MQTVTPTRLVGLALAALLTIGAGLSATATFEAPAPGADLEPIGDAGSLISLVQGQEHLLWTALTGSVTSYTTIGWPSSDGEVELGGAMVVVRPADGSAGVIEPAEKPMALEFELNR